MRLTSLVNPLLALLSTRRAKSACKSALLELAEAAGFDAEIPAAFAKAEASVHEAYSQANRASINRIRGITEIRAHLRANTGLVAYVVDLYLGVHHPECFSDKDRSLLSQRVAVDFLQLLISADVAVPASVRTPILKVAALVRERLRHEPYPEGYSVSKRWGVIVNRAMGLLSYFNDPFHIAYIGMTMFDVEMPILSQGLADDLRKRREEYATRFPELRNVGDTYLMRPGTTLLVDGVSYSQKVDQAFSYYAYIFSNVPASTSSSTVVEIGTGNGRFARIMRLAGRSKCYVLVDLAESLVFSHAFLRLHFPEARMIFVSSRDDIRPGLTTDFDFVFCPIQQLGSLTLDGVDLVVNTYSFAEMSQPCVDYILDCVHEKIRPRFFYSLNMVFCDKTIHFDSGGLDGEANEVVLRMRAEWRPRGFKLVPAITDNKWRTTGSVLLERAVGTSRHELVGEMLDAAGSTSGESGATLIYLYLAALWARDLAIAERFFKELRRFLAANDFVGRAEFSFEDIGEVRYLKRLAGSLTAIPR